MTAVLSRYLEVVDATEELARDVAAGLTRSPKELPPKWLYDARGSELFEDITRLPEYYPTRAEREILQRRAGEIASSTQADMLVELGAGTLREGARPARCADRRGQLHEPTSPPTSARARSAPRRRR